jgi:uncharacterized protein (TIRG00374 family)
VIPQIIPLLNLQEGKLLNLETFRTAIVFFLMLITTVFLVRIYWTDIIITLGESPEIIGQVRIRYFFLAFLAYLLSVYLFAVGLVIWIFRANVSSTLYRVRNHWRQLHKSFVAVLLLSSGVWVLDVTRFKLIALALDLPLSLPLIATVSVLYLVLGSLPITPGGLGIVEGGLISILLYFGLPLAPASSFVFLERVISFGLSSLIGFFYLFYYGGFKIWKSAKLH